MNSIPRPIVTPDRYRELEILAWQIAQGFPHQNVGECLIVKDLVDNVLRRWAYDERLVEHEVARTGAVLITGNNITHLRPVD